MKLENTWQEDKDHTESLEILQIQNPSVFLKGSGQVTAIAMAEPYFCAQ